MARLLSSTNLVTAIAGSIVKGNGPDSFTDLSGISGDGALSGITQALTVGAGNDLIVVPEMIVRRSASALSHYCNIYINGGGLGSTTSGYNFTSAGGNQVNDNVNQYYSTYKLDTAPTTSPTYTMYCFVGGGTWTFLNIKFTFFEIKG